MFNISLNYKERLVILKPFFFLFGIGFLALFFSCNRQSDYSYINYSAQLEKDAILSRILPYTSPLPPGATLTTRFTPEYEAYYKSEAVKYQWKYYYISDNGTHYFALSRTAPSRFKKRILIAGKFTLGTDNTLENYEEVFWTFKMPEEELDKKGLLLFEKMVKGENLQEYYPGKKGNEEWIEFPDDKTTYDKNKKRWKMIWEK